MKHLGAAERNQGVDRQIGFRRPVRGYGLSGTKKERGFYRIFSEIAIAKGD
jgi:hypothetical protein